jgi:AraC-like DNA-binding protein
MIARVKARIDDDPAGAVSLSDLALLIGISRFQLIRAFVRATSFTTHAYIIQRRVDVVQRLIRGGKPLAQAALSAGFVDQSHMTKAFVARLGVAPGEYAKAMV